MEQEDDVQKYAVQTYQTQRRTAAIHRQPMNPRLFATAAYGKFHRFPKTGKYGIISERIKYNPTICARICSLHFKQRTYKINMKYELLHLPLFQMVILF